MSAHGILVANKPRGMTSHDVVSDARRIFGTRKVGHAGTLDPMASGVLVLLFGEATKLGSHLTASDKEYLAEVTFGRSTDTHDADGRTVADQVLESGWLDERRLDAAIAAERARTLQTPPEFSAISVDGVRAHRRARRGETVTLEPRPVRVGCLEVVGRDGTTLTFSLAVSKGYYVRAFARDLGEHLGVPAHLSGLVRTASGRFRLESATAWPPEGARPLIPVATAAGLALPAAVLTASGVEKAACGQKLAAQDFAEAPPPRGTAAWLSGDGRLVALGAPDTDGTFRVQRGFHDNS